VSEDYGYGDCKDTCPAYAIESEYACMRCAEQMDEEMRQEEEDWMEGCEQG